jgi:tetratricopeptide (TPR) repeat protein
LGALLLRDGIERQRAGDLAVAEAIYAAILERTPDDGMARTLLGLVLCAGDRFEAGVQTIREAIASGGGAYSCFSLGQALLGRQRLTEAAEAFRQSIELQPGVVAAHIGLGQALTGLGDYAGAAAALRKAVALDPSDAEPFVCTGKLLHQLGRLQEAVAQFDAAIGLAPARSDCWVALGRALLALGQTEDAAAAAGQAVALDPDCAVAQVQLGDVRRRQRDGAAACACYGRAIALDAALPEAHCHLSNALYDLGRFEEAVAAAAAAIGLRPDYAEAYSNRGNALLALLELERAEADYRSAIRLEPGSAAFYSNLGSALTAQERVAEALAAQRRALAIDPDFVDARYNHGISLLLAGLYEPGWRYYESRWQQPWNPPRAFSQPRWTGEPLGGRCILLHAEQGLGDMLQMARYVPLVAARGGRVVLEVHPPLVRLLEGLTGVQAVIPLGAALPAFDVHCPLFSLPLVFGTRLDTIPAEPYLRADPALVVPDPVASSRAMLRSRTGLRVGVVWQGGARIGAYVNRERSLSLEQLAPLAGIPGVDLYGLQKDLDTASAKTAGALGIVDLMPDVVDFADTAALVAELDLIISVDTSTAHLAAGMGKPVWLLSRYSGCWRWLTGRTDSPWYPSLRLYRQDQPRDWAVVIARVAEDLADEANRTTDDGPRGEFSGFPVSGRSPLCVRISESPYMDRYSLRLGGGRRC